MRVLAHPKAPKLVAYADHDAGVANPLSRPRHHWPSPQALIENRNTVFIARSRAVRTMVAWTISCTSRPTPY